MFGFEVLVNTLIIKIIFHIMQFDNIFFINYQSAGSMGSSSVSKRRVCIIYINLDISKVIENN